MIIMDPFCILLHLEMALLMIQQSTELLLMFILYLVTIQLLQEYFFLKAMLKLPAFLKRSIFKVDDSYL